MSTTDLENFLPEVLIHAPMVPQALAVNEIRNAAIEFCEKTEISVQSPAAMNVVADQPDYTPTLTAGTLPVLPTYVEYDGSPLNPITTDELDFSATNWRNSDSSTPARYYSETAGVVSLYPPPDENIASGLVVKMSTKPARDATVVDAILLNDWMEVIAQGALARILSVPGKDWSNPQLGVYYRSQFDIGIDRAKQSKLHGMVRGSRRIKPRRFV